MHEAEVAAGDPHDRRDGLSIGEISIVEFKAELVRVPLVSVQT
jgi:hypothetical protein